ncbi:MAG: sigma 54-interacting transcriptional regulator [Gammaproteobacteria bacterium]|nr:sigma 54-interacting transcriptional regulator [Gammaproteobacteria bacterium]
MGTKKLTSAERTFLDNAVGVIYANPFSADRDLVDKRLVDFPAGENYTLRYQRIISAIADGVSGLVSSGHHDIRQFSGTARDLLESVLIFHVYHQVFLEFDSLIEKQLGNGDTPVKVPFARDALAMLHSFGFAEEAAERYFAAFFQIRRAYYFIGTSIIGRSPCMRGLREALWNNVITSDIGLYMRTLVGRMEDYSTLLLGETGCGKGISAAAIGRSAFIPFDSNRGCFRLNFNRSFMSINLSQFSESLIESELFGHEKGAFTGAVSNYEGVLARCSRYGAVFLDEIGEVSLPVQVKLLRVLEDRRFMPVGSYEQKQFEGRIIAATNQSLDRLREENRFRDDFYYRLCSDVIHVPPLRQRIAEDEEELDDLVVHTLARIVGTSSPELADRVISCIRDQIPRDYPWPGNVRELEQCIRRLLLKRRYEAGPASLHKTNDIDGMLKLVEQGSASAQELLSSYCRKLYGQHGSYETVARITRLDRRTVKKYIDI